MMKAKLLSLICILGFTLITSGCAPHMMGDSIRDGSYPEAMFMDDRAKFMASMKYKLETKGENLTVVITASDGTCNADLKINEARKGYSPIPVMRQEPQLNYTGKWQSDFSTECLKLVGHPGGTQVYANIAEPDDGKRAVHLCTGEDEGLLFCSPTNMLGFFVPVVGGVDDK